MACGQTGVKSFNPSKDKTLNEVLERFIYHIRNEFHPAKDQALNRDQVQSQNQDQTNDKNKIIVCKDERDWIDPESNLIYKGFKKFYIKMITSTIMSKFKDIAIVPDDMCELNNDIAYYFTEVTNYNIQMI